MFDSRASSALPRRPRVHLASQQRGLLQPSELFHFDTGFAIEIVVRRDSLFTIGLMAGPRPGMLP